MRPTDRTVKIFGAYATVAVVSVTAAVLLLDLPHADLRVPFDYGGDALLYALITKSVVDHGWFWHNPSVGVPDGLDFHDFPASAHDSVHLLIIKAMSLFTGDWALLFNLYFLLGFPLIALSAAAVFRHFRVSDGPAVVGAVLYAFLPSRLIKGEGHIFMDVFYQVPLAILVLLWVLSDDPPLARAPGESRGFSRWLPFEVRRPRSWGSLLICALNASTCLYYAFFTAMLLVAGGLWASVTRRTTRNLVAGTGLAAAIVVGLAANGLPSIVCHAYHGANHQVADRKAWEAEAYGMKIAQLLLPVDGHRVSALRRLKDRYAVAAPLNGENGATSLGVVGSVGFLYLLWVAISGRRDEEDPSDPRRRISVLNWLAVLLGTIGGFGSLFAWLVSPQIRTYSRINVLIGFFSLFAVVLLLDRATRDRKRLATVVLPAVLLVGLLDQVSPLATRDYALTKSIYESDEGLVRRIEAAVPPETSILELPYQSFPEAPAVLKLESYDPVRPYLHSHSVRWSFPTMHGRPGETFTRSLSGLEPGRLVEAAASAGFGGIWIDRGGYPGDGSSMRAALQAVLDAEPMVSADGRFSFFDLADYAKRTHTGEAPGEVAYRRYLMLHPLGVDWDEGCYGVEHDFDRSFRWCSASGEIRIENETAVRRTVSLR
ncbi:MAG: hypothetical protein JOZ69_07255, partial [Myxococcales bacterium]|nr:hypothetical protein [Myxococcales bacterium]